MGVVLAARAAERHERRVRLSLLFALAEGHRVSRRPLHESVVPAGSGTEIYSTRVLTMCRVPVYYLNLQYL